MMQNLAEASMTPTSSSEEAVELWDDDLALLLGDADDSAYKSSPKTIRAALDEPASTVKVVECGDISPEEFASRHRHREPVLLRGFARHWPAIAQWKDVASLAASGAGAEDVRVLSSANNRRFLIADCEQSVRPLSAVIDAVFGTEAQRIYARAPLRGGLRDGVDLRVLEELMGGVSPKESCCSVWIGPPGNITPFHYDLCHGWLIGVRGVKTFTLVHPDEHRCMYSGHNERPELSKIDYEAWRAGDEQERSRHPKFAHAVRRTVEVHEGDALYTPPFHWHHVETSASDGPAVSVLVPFDPRPDEPVHVSHLR